MPGRDIGYALGQLLNTNTIVHFLDSHVPAPEVHRRRSDESRIIQNDNGRPLKPEIPNGEMSPVGCGLLSIIDFLQATLLLMDFTVHSS